MGHIELSRDADLLVVAPATADLLAKMAHGLANDLASTALLATDKPVLAAPAMNVRMWQHPATQRNLATLRGDGISFVGPDEGEMACGEFGLGPHGRARGHRRRRAGALLDGASGRTPRGTPDARDVGSDARAHRPRPLHRQPLLGQAGPRHRRSACSAGRRGHAGLRPGRASPIPPGVRTVHVETAREMLAAVEAALPADAAVFCAAVADWRVGRPGRGEDEEGRRAARQRLRWSRTPTSSRPSRIAPQARPDLVVGFAAETREGHRARQGQAGPQGMRLDRRQRCQRRHRRDGRRPQHRPSRRRPAGVESWPTMGKDAVARALAQRIAESLKDNRWV